MCAAELSLVKLSSVVGKDAIMQSFKDVALATTSAAALWEKVRFLRTAVPVVYLGCCWDPVAGGSYLEQLGRLLCCLLLQSHRYP